MKFLVIFAVAVACAAADVAHLASADATAPIVRSSYDFSPDGKFNYEFETGNKIQAQVDGVVKDPNSDSPTLEVRGTYAYVAPDGTPVQTSYIANEDGFQPSGSHIPVAPEIPEAILRGLQYIRDHPPPVERVSGKF